MTEKEIIKIVEKSRGKLIRIVHNTHRCGEQDVYGINRGIKDKHVFLEFSTNIDGKDPSRRFCYIPDVLTAKVLSVKFVAWVLTDLKKLIWKLNKLD